MAATIEPIDKRFAEGFYLGNHSQTVRMAVREYLAQSHAEGRKVGKAQFVAGLQAVVRRVGAVVIEPQDIGLEDAKVIGTGFGVSIPVMGAKIDKPTFTAFRAGGAA